MQPEGWGQDPDLWPRASTPSLYRCLHCSCQLQGSGDGDFHLSTCFQVGGSGVPTYMVRLFFNFLYANESACWTCMVGGRKATLLRPFLLCHLVLWEWPPERLTWYSVGSTGSERSSRYLGAYRWMSLCITYVVFFFFFNFLWVLKIKLCWLLLLQIPPFQTYDQWKSDTNITA